MQSQQTQRHLGLDLVRIVAILAVVMIHASASFLVSYPAGSFEFSVGNLGDGISRLGVPLFVMLSGALMLDEQRNLTLKRIFTKNVKSIVILTVLWAAIYACVEKVITPWMGGQPIQWDTVLPTIVEGHYHMWYLYMLVGLYLATPFLREIVKKKNKNLVLAFIGLCLLFQFTNPVITVISHFLGSEWKILSTILGKFSFGLFGSYTGYYLTGWYLAHIGPESTRQRRLLYALGITGLASVLLYTHFTGEYKVLYNNLGLPVYFYSASVFYALSHFSPTVSPRTSSWIAALSKASFGIYILHPLFLGPMKIHFSHTQYPAVWCISLYFLGSILLSWLTSILLARIPLLKALVRM